MKNKTIYEKPKYQEVKNTYEILKPITKQIMELPIQTKKKIKTTKTIYQKEIKEENEEELNKILNGENIALITPKLGITTSAIDPSKRHYEILEYIVDKEKRYKNNKEREELIQELED
mgnify:CR=1 FL=1